MERSERETLKMWRNAWLRVAAVVLLLLITGARCLRNVRLEVTPEKVELGQEASLRCRYDLEGVPLYSLKWYRGQHEFYRYSPSESTKIFNFTWITVDPHKSNETQVTIQNVDFPLSGNFSCEVTTDAPTFSTASSHRTLTVVSVPKGKPVIASERGRYVPGEYLKANCSVAPSKPPARLFFTLNDVQVQGEEKQQQQVGASGEQPLRSGDPGRQWTRLNLHLQPFHYVNGLLNLRCTARIDGVYEESSELRLGAPTSGREPVPERVTSENAAGATGRRAAGAAVAGSPLLLLLLQRLSPR